MKKKSYDTNFNLATLNLQDQERQASAIEELEQIYRSVLNNTAKPISDAERSHVLRKLGEVLSARGDQHATVSAMRYGEEALRLLDQINHPAAAEVRQQMAIWLTWIRQRYGELVDRKFAASLSSTEADELRRLAAILDEADAPFYRPLMEALRKERDRLANAQSKKD